MKNSIIAVVICLLIFILCAQRKVIDTKYNDGYEKGYHHGYCEALDTAQAILENQVGNDSTVTRLCIINRDTVWYTLESKCSTQ